MNKEELINRIRNAEYFIEQNTPYYHAKESDCPDSFKFLMLLNGWHNPFVALNELLKVIDKNEMLIKRASKQGAVIDYKSRYKEMFLLVQKEVNKNGGELRRLNKMPDDY